MKFCFALVLFLSSATPSPLLSAQEANKNKGLHDGPYVFHNQDESVLVRWIDDGKAAQRKFAKGKPITLPEFPGLWGQELRLVPHQIDASEWTMPEKLMVISDVEGEHKRLKKFLRANKVTNDKGQWIFGKGHLVCVGDFVDRGKKVTEVLWLIYRLQREAEAVGGHVHMIIGNHEAMMLSGDERYLAKKYVRCSKILGMRMKDLYGPNTELGRWLRSRNALVRIGPYVFVHGGVSPNLAFKKVDYAGVNSTIRAVLNKDPRVSASNQAAGLFWGRYGPLWYRGYYKKHEANFGPHLNEKQVDKILGFLGAKTMIIGHTKVKKVTEVYPKKKVINIDTTWTKNKKVHGLYIVHQNVRIVDINGKISLLDSDRSPPKN